MMKLNLLNKIPYYSTDFLMKKDSNLFLFVVNLEDNNQFCWATSLLQNRKIISSQINNQADKRFKLY